MRVLVYYTMFISLLRSSYTYQCFGYHDKIDNRPLFKRPDRGVNQKKKKKIKNYSLYFVLLASLFL